MTSRRERVGRVRCGGLGAHRYRDDRSELTDGNAFSMEPWSETRTPALVVALGNTRPSHMYGI
jgi:hypothetical protein